MPLDFAEIHPRCGAFAWIIDPQSVSRVSRVTTPGAARWGRRVVFTYVPMHGSYFACGISRYCTLGAIGRYKHMMQILAAEERCAS